MEQENEDEEDGTNSGDEMGMYGFTRDEEFELLCQGVKPWDDDARAVLNALSGEGDYYDDYDDDEGDEYDEEEEEGLTKEEEREQEGERKKVSIAAPSAASSGSRLLAPGSSLKMTLVADSPTIFDDAGAREEIYKMFVINGGIYCRPHLRSSCHVCEVEYTFLNDELDDKRRGWGERNCGDRGLDEASMVLKDVCIKARRDFEQEQEAFNLKGGEGWKEGLRESAVQNEARINATYKVASCTQCAWKDCKNPSKEGLMTCGRCKVVKYCCVEHQKLDYKWEHKLECVARSV